VMGRAIGANAWRVQHHDQAGHPPLDNERDRRRSSTPRALAVTPSSSRRAAGRFVGTRDGVRAWAPDVSASNWRARHYQIVNHVRAP